MSCCASDGLQDVFTDDVSRRDADRYRKHGLDARGRKLLKTLEADTPLPGRSALEIGAGAGALVVEMLRRGAAHLVAVDAVPAQIANARRLADDYGVGDRADFLLAEFPAGETVPDADIVIMDRVICCYDDWGSLLAGAARRTRRTVVITYPRRVWWFKPLYVVMNAWWWLLRSRFRFHVRPPALFQAALAERGFAAAVAGRHYIWEIMIARRSGS